MTIPMMQAALFQLGIAIDAVEDPFIRSQMRLATNVLAGAIDAAAAGVDAAKVGDIEFALNDVASLAADLAGPDAEATAGPLRMLQEDVASLRAATALPPELVAGIRALQTKMRIRKAAIERQTYVEDASAAAPLPHEPRELQSDAQPIRERLASAGFATPALDAFLSDPDSLRFHSLRDIIDELDVIAG